MQRRRIRVLTVMLAAITLTLGFMAPTTSGAQSEMPSCMVDVSAQPLAQAMPPNADGYALVALRLTIGPVGGFQPHTHPGVVTVTIESGTLDFTLLEDDDMVINRVPANGTPVPTDPVELNQPITTNPGDWFVEAGTIHEAWNTGDQPTVVLVTGLIDPSKPFVQCAGAATPIAGSTQHVG